MNLNKYMKRYLIICMLGLGACSGSNTGKTGNTANKLPASLVSNPHTADGMDTVAAAMKPYMAFKDTLHDFGTMHEDEVVQYEFAFTNTGKTPLIINSASGSCGCTVPEYPRDPIEAGKSGIMKVTFNSRGKSGHQEKSVTIHTNTVKGIEMLYIKAEVSSK